MPSMENVFDGSALGLVRGAVHVVPSDPAWPATFDRLSSRLHAALSDVAIAIEHVGSTSVAGLPAKPILDVAVGLPPGSDTAGVTAALESLGFLYRGAGDEDSIDLMFGWEDEPRHRLVNLHVVTFDGPAWRAYLAFRDRLRANHSARDSYAELKRDLARRFPGDRRSYIAGKDEFVRQILSE